MEFTGWLVTRDDDGARAALQSLDPAILDDLPVTVRVTHSGVNYKDALALLGRPGVIRRHPLVAGIDLVGEVTESQDARWTRGDTIVVNGAGLGEATHGGLATLARVPADAAIALPAAFTPHQAAAIGTAGLTAALCLNALERHGVTPESGPMLVTGSGGGVGSIAVALAAAAGYETHALTGRPDELGERLRLLGASDVVDRTELERDGKPLERQRWASVVDTAGGTILAGALAGLLDGGTATACGLAASPALPTTVLPFILRGVSLLGVNSVRLASDVRAAAWDRLARDLSPHLLESLTRTVALADAAHAAVELLEGHGTGRTVVAVDA